jgi:hypothetical protein
MPDHVMPVMSVMPVVVMRPGEGGVGAQKHQAHGNHSCANLLHTSKTLMPTEKTADYRTSRAL